jgi:predicted alpha/beta superfamily hydrolase
MNKMKSILSSLGIFLVLSINLLGLEPKTESGKVISFPDFQSNYVDARNVDVWVPEDYQDTKQYAVIYMHDGQMLFDSTNTWNKQEWQVDEVLSKLMKENKIQDCLVVGIWNNGEYRRAEYFPEKALAYLSDESRDTLIAEWLMGEPLADEYLRFLTEELKPFIDKRFKVHTDREHTFIAGSSMGGLISAYAICEYPQIFGGAACLSTHWIGTYQGNVLIPEAFNNYLTEFLPEPANHRIYFDFGTDGIDRFYEPYQQQVDETMRIKGFDEKNWLTKKYPGEDHSEISWAKRLSVPFTFILN